jgi:hypothetical protein
MFFVITKEEKGREDLTLAVADNGKLLVVSRERKESKTGYTVPNFFIFGTVWKWDWKTLSSLPRKELNELLREFEERNFLVEPKKGIYKLLKDYILSELRKRKKEKEKKTEVPRSEQLL